jgi:hypothetical protein
MRYWSFDTGFGYDNLVLHEADTPRPGPRDVLLEMRAASLNYRDIVVLNGQHGRRVQPPLIPLSDGVGTVIETGPTSPTCKPGDRVAPVLLPELGGRPPARRSGGRAPRRPARRVCWQPTASSPPAASCPFPDHLTDAEAATLPCAGVTAWSAIIGDGPGATRRDRPHPRLRRCRADGDPAGKGGGGADHRHHLLRRSAPSRLGRLAPTTSSTAPPRPTGRQRRARPDRWHGVDRVMELGGAATLPTPSRPPAPARQIILIGNVTGNTAELFLPAILTRQLTLRAVTVGSEGGLRRAQSARWRPIRSAR